MTATDSITIRKASSSDLSLLFNLSRISYVENYADHWNDGGLEWYLEKVYGWDGLKLDLVDPAISYFIAFVNEEAAGFIKLRFDSNLPGYPSTNAMEVEKIYFRLPFKGKGIGKKLMAVALLEAKRLRKEIIWLAVIDTNRHAIEFYRKVGFELHEKTALDIPYFKEELKGMWRMKLKVEEVNG
jgi:ribosomal protein S18 acetylase RimI-like enzyme